MSGFYTNFASLLFQGKILNNILIEKIAGKCESNQVINESNKNSYCALLEETLLCKLISSSNFTTDFADSTPYNDTGYLCSSTIRDKILTAEFETRVNKHAKANIAARLNEEIDEIQSLHINNQVYRRQQVIMDIESPKTTIIKLESTVHSMENAIKDYDAILS